MTAVNVIIRPNGLHVLTDGLGLDESTGERTLVAKVMPLAHLRAALAVRGPAVTIPLIAITLCLKAPTFDAAAAGMGEVLRAVHGQFVQAGHAGLQFEAVLAGWSEKHDRPECWVSPSHDLYGEPPFSVIPFGAGFVQPLAALDGLWGRATDDPTFDPVTDGLALLRLQRDIPAMQVGGYAQRTSVYRDRIETRILERWE